MKHLRRLALASTVAALVARCVQLKARLDHHDILVMDQAVRHAEDMNALFGDIAERDTKIIQLEAALKGAAEEHDRLTALAGQQHAEEEQAS